MSTLEKRLRGLIIEVPSVQRTWQDHGPLHLFSPFFPHYNNLERSSSRSEAHCPRDRDEIVPFSWAEAFRSRREPKFFYPVKDAGHNDVFVVGGKVFRGICRFSKNIKYRKR
jgi:hypothetical protein